jgi:hypothetical protein
MKSKKQENIIVAPRKRYGGLASESREKVAILSNSNPSSESQNQISLQQYYHNELAQQYKI